MMFFKKIFFLFMSLIIVGCSTTEEFFDDITAPDYVNSSRAKRLEVPPDLTELEADSGYNVPGEAKSYREFLDKENRALSDGKNNKKRGIVENPEGMQIVKSGNLRWLVVEKEPEVIWPYVKEFWEELGFRVLVSNKKTGIIETEWMDTDDIKIERASSNALSTFDKWLDSLSGFADKRKFRTRVEFGENRSTEIYISQRSAEAAADQHTKILRERSTTYNPSTAYKIEEYKSDSDLTKKIEVSEQREIDDYEIDSELLTKLMIKLGATDFDANKKINNPQIIVKAELFDNVKDAYIKLNDPYDRAWRRLGLALDIIGFVTEDKNRSDGIYYVRFSEFELPNESKEEEKGIIDSLIFWNDDDETKDDVSDATTLNTGNKEELLDEIDSNEPKYTGIEPPEVKPLDEDYIPEEDLMNKDVKTVEEESWFTDIWPSWGSEDEKSTLPDNEKRYRVRIKPIDESSSIVYLDFPNNKKNISNEARKVLKIIAEYLK